MITLCWCRWLLPLVRVVPPGGHQQQRRLAVEREAAGLVHAQVLRRHPLRQRPVEAVEQVGQREDDVGLAHGQPGADPPPRPERHQLEVRAAVVDVAAVEALRPELLGAVAPGRGVPADGPRVHEHARPRRHVVPAHPHAARRLPGQQQRRRRVQPQGLLHHRLQADEDVDEVPAAAVHVLVDDHLEEGVEVPEHALAARDEAREAVHQAPGGVGEEVLGGEAGHHVHGLVHRVLEPLPVREPLRAVDAAERHRADDAVHAGEDVLVQCHCHRRGATGGEVGDEPVHLLLPRAPGGLDAPLAQQLHDEEPAHLAPVLAVGREGHVLEAVGQAAGPRRVGPAAAVGVVLLHHLPRRRRRRHHQRRHRAQAEQHDGAVPARQLAEAPVRQRAQQVQVAQDGNLRGARRQVRAAAPPAPRQEVVGRRHQQQDGHQADRLPLLRQAGEEDHLLGLLGGGHGHCCGPSAMSVRLSCFSLSLSVPSDLCLDLVGII
ncbi:hypothetical protein U9M48_011190 [Paspalum notatum var. saurae]|uniref:Uncharacterized protein n=1 Tax=Paspalum notatum var. saurae TaxID=547442 RepID=A0AAQ3SUQ8_PASNO